MQSWGQLWKQAEEEDLYSLILCGTWIQHAIFQSFDLASIVLRYAYNYRSYVFENTQKLVFQKQPFTRAAKKSIFKFLMLCDCDEQLDELQAENIRSEQYPLLCPQHIASNESYLCSVDVGFFQYMNHRIVFQPQKDAPTTTNQYRRRIQISKRAQRKSLATFGKTTRSFV